MPATYSFLLREAPSDVVGPKTLSDAGGLPIELDYALAAGAGIALVDSFLSAAPLPGVGLWVAGTYLVGLNVAQANLIAFTVELWRADANGNDVAQIGARPATQTLPNGPGAIGFSVSGQTLDPSQNQSLSTTDRLKLKLYAQNNDATNAETLGITASASGVSTPITLPDNATNKFNPFRRNKFLGFRFRPGEGANFFDKNGVDIVPRGGN